MTSPTLSAAELAAAVRDRGTANLSEGRARDYLARWVDQGIVEQPFPGRFRLTLAGRAMFAGWAALEPDHDDDQEAAA